MLDGTLVCRVMPMAQGPFGAYEAAAQKWTGEDALDIRSGDLVSWVETESAQLGTSEWLVEAGPLDYRARRAIAKIGQQNGVDFIAVVSEFASVTALLQDQIRRHLTSRSSGRTGESIRLAFDQLDDSGWRLVNHIECRSEHFVLAATALPDRTLPPAPGDLAVTAIGMTIHDVTLMANAPTSEEAKTLARLVATLVSDDTLDFALLYALEGWHLGRNAVERRAGPAER